MSRWWALAAFAILAVATPAFGHRLDQYLQATTLSLGSGKVDLSMRLTPGVSVAGKVIAAIDRNGDGIASAAEQQAYARRVQGDLMLTVDDHPVALELGTVSFPPLEDMRQGLGDIVLEFSAAIPSGGPSHTLVLENRHERAVAVYLVNCLVPKDPAIRILGQDRNVEQSVYRLQFGLVDSAAKAPPTADSGSWAVVKTFLGHGVWHILTGYDHLLFVAALVLGAATLWDLVKVVTAFTVAHSITLTLATFDLVHLPSRVVEPLISASIVFVALQNVLWPRQSRGMSRLAAAFFFGLFHGLGFAGGLLEIMHQMPRTTVYLALLGFSLGVEGGNQVVLLPSFILLKAAARRQTASTMLAVRRAGSAGVALAGMYYLGLALLGKT